MNETTQSTQHLVRALSSFQRTCEHAIMAGLKEGQAHMIIKQYSRLHTQVRQALPDDAYVASLVVDSDPDDPKTLNQLSFAISQLSIYVKELQ